MNLARLPSLTLIATLALCASARAAEPDVTLFETPAEALREIVRRQPRAQVLAFGEVHQTTDGPGATPAIRRFSDEMISVLTKGELIVETWVTQGACGEVEKQVVADVAKMTKRPESTETDIARLIRLGKVAGLAPHILELTCDVYRSLQDKDGKLDAVALLGAVTEELERSILKLLPRAPVIVYGGALHNDRAPRKELAQFSFAASIERAARGRYVEVDLYVPEYVDVDPAITGTRWWPRYKKALAGHERKTALVRTGERSYVVLFARTQHAE